ncbi:MAG TPA: ABC transporter permease, partial [Conexibacter sp.]
MATVDSTVRAGAPGGWVGPGPAGGAAGVGPYRLALRRLRRNKAALAFGALFLLIVVLCLCAPLYAEHVAHTGPNANHVTETVTVGGTSKDVVSPTGQPIGPTWHGRFLLGADQNGRDIAVRLLYGGRNSLEVGAVATL